MFQIKYMFSSMPKISVVMCVYKEPLEWVALSINSILIQTFRNFEFIIVDDDPTNKKLLLLLQDYETKDTRVKIIVNERNLGLTKSLNIALNHARGTFIARMDADDISSKYRLQKQICFLNEHPNVDICGTWAKKMGNVGLFDQKSLKLPVQHEEIVVGFVFSSQIIHPSVLVRSEVFNTFKYDEDAIKAQDYDLWVRLILAGKKFSNIPEKLIRYRVTTKSRATSYTNLQELTADKSRRILINFLYPIVDENSIDIHNRICNGNRNTFESVLEWLITLQLILCSKFPHSKKYILGVINKQWFNYCVSNKICYFKYKHSQLYVFSVNILFRYVKSLFLSK